MNPDMDRVLLWRMYMPSTEATTWIGVLEDGTVFQKLRNQPWKTVIRGPADTDKSFAFVVEMTRVNEEAGMFMTGPVEFGIGSESTDNIRVNMGWLDTELVLTIGFDMAVRAAERSS